jgi:hypothetical protein
MILPFSESLRETRESDGLMTLLLSLVKNGWVCFVVYYITRNANYTGMKLFINLMCVMFSVLFFMTQMELLFFINAFPSMVKLDAIFFMICGFVPLLITIPLLIKYFQNKNAIIEIVNINLKYILLKLGIIGIVYCFIYYILGYFIAWQFQDMRIFYFGSDDFLQQRVHKYSLLMLPIQYFRGVLFGLFVLPLRKMISKNKINFIASICMVYLSMGFMLLSPTALFPDMVRYVHLIEMTLSMLLFGIMVGNILWYDKKQKTST